MLPSYLKQLSSKLTKVKHPERKTQVYLNLTNGLNFLKPESRGRYKVCRIQSTHLEQKHLWKVILEIDYQFLMDAALCKVSIYDEGSAKMNGVSRALYQGIPWIFYAYARRSYGPEESKFLTRTNFPYSEKTLAWFEEFYRSRSHESRQALGKLDYVLKMTKVKELSIKSYGAKATNDGNYEALSEKLIATYGRY